MACNSTNSSPSPIALVMLSASFIEPLDKDTPYPVVATRINEFRERLWELIEVAPDPAGYTVAWNTINLYVKADLLAYEQGDRGALARLKEKVREAVELSP